MTERIDSLREHYSALGDDELQNIAIEGGLGEDARQLLELELHRRGIGDVGEYKEYRLRTEQEQVRKKQQALQRKDQSIRLYRRIGYGVSLFGILAGLFALYILKDEKNGIGMIIASAILLPLVWIIAVVRRLVWRFLL